MLADHEGDNRIGSDPVGVGGGIGYGLMAGVPAAATHGAAGARENRYEFSYLERLGLIIGIAAGIIALAGSLTVGVHVVTQLLQGHRIDLSDSAYRR